MSFTFEQAKAALRKAARLGISNASREYAQLIEAIREMEAHLGMAGITTEMQDGTDPATVTFTTPVGVLQMSRLLTVDEEQLVYTIAFSDETPRVRETAEQYLWWVQLNWSSPWKDAAGVEFERDFATDATKPHQIIGMVQSAAAAKMIRDAARLKPA